MLNVQLQSRPMVFAGQRIEWRYFELDRIQYVGENNARGVIRLVTI